MLLTRNDKPIKRVAVVNDTAAARDEMAENLFDAGLEPIIQNARLNSIDECITSVTSKAEAAILEHHINQVTIRISWEQRPLHSCIGNIFPHYW